MSRAELPLLSLQDVGHDFGHGVLFQDVDVSIRAGERICLVGRNGCGKSTLLKILAGEIACDSGRRWVSDGIQAAYVPQAPVLDESRSLHAIVSEGLRAEDADKPYLVDAAIEQVGLSDQVSIGHLSGGEQRRVVMARALVGKPDILLMDEPTNHLDLPTIEWLEGVLERFQGALVVVSHDRAFLTRLTRRVIWIDRGQVRALEQGFEKVEAWMEQVFEEEAVQRAKLDKFIATETRWSREGISARRKRNQGRLRRLHTLRAERGQQRARLGVASLRIEEGQRSGKVVIESKGVHKSFDERVIVRPLNLRILRGDRVGIIGPNGAGKTTLLRLLTGELEPDGGQVRHGTSLTPVYLDQHRAELDDALTVQQVLCGPVGDHVEVHGRPKHVVGYLKDFLFDARMARSLVADLSGGERQRLLLAKTLAKPSNLLILDEPTNDLDLETLDLLQDVLSDYPGTLLMVSHDRDFLDRVVTQTLAFEGGGEVVVYAGGYTDVLAQRRALAQGAEQSESRPAERGANKRAKRGNIKKKLSYAEARELESLFAQLETLNDEVEGLEVLLADSEAYARDPKGFTEASKRVALAREERTEVEERWLELELLKESLGAS